MPWGFAWKINFRDFILSEKSGRFYIVGSLRNFVDTVNTCDDDGDGVAYGKLECAGRLFKDGVLATVGHLRLLLVPHHNHLGSQCMVAH